MNTIKISVTFRSMDIVWDYKSKHDREIGDDLHKALSEAFGITPAHNANGRFSHTFELQSDLPLEECETIVKMCLMAVLPDESAFGSVSFSVKSTQQEPLQKEESPIKGITREPATDDSANEMKFEMIRREDKGEAQETKCKTDKEAITLSGQANKLTLMKEGLLQKVKGQRHAVEEVVQTIFECEMFASQDPDRITPLATFLFTGPSGVGKTFLANQCKNYLDREILVVDMTEYSDNLANNKFNGDHGEANVVTGFAHKHPNGIIVFDEIEKAHLNTIHLFLQILDAGRLMDFSLKKEISFRNNIIIMTTNAGKELYDDPNVFDLSGTPRSVILDALRKDVNPVTHEPYFPECITTRMANGHVVLFNHLEPFALTEIIKTELKKQIGLFESASGVKVEYDPDQLAALILYHGGGTADARSLRGLAKNIVVRELQEIVMQLYRNGAERVKSDRSHVVL